jgi:hypothetical protein
MASPMTRRRAAAVLAATIAALSIPVASAVADGMHGGTDTGGGTGTMPQMETHMAPAKMTAELRVSKDRKMGYNINVRTTAFRWAPWNASKPHVQGQGHGHLYVNGKKVTRLYGPWYFLGDLKKGRNVIKVTLNGNDHGDYVRDGAPIAVSKVVMVK